jgi:hypothetical protein
VLSTEFNNATSYHADISMSIKIGMKKPLCSGIQFSELLLKSLSILNTASFINRVLPGGHKSAI